VLKCLPYRAKEVRHIEAGLNLHQKFQSFSLVCLGHHRKDGHIYSSWFRDHTKNKRANLVYKI